MNIIKKIVIIVAMSTLFVCKLQGLYVSEFRIDPWEKETVAII